MVVVIGELFGEFEACEVVVAGERPTTPVSSSTARLR